MKIQMYKYLLPGTLVTTYEMCVCANTPHWGVLSVKLKNNARFCFLTSSMLVLWIVCLRWYSLMSNSRIIQGFAFWLLLCLLCELCVCANTPQWGVISVKLKNNAMFCVFTFYMLALFALILLDVTLCSNYFAHYKNKQRLWQTVQSSSLTWIFTFCAILTLLQLLQKGPIRNI